MAREFAHACLMTLLPALRVPSEALQMVRAFANDQMIIPTQKENDLIRGFATPEWPRLMAKRPRRQNLAGGCIVRRPRFFGPPHHHPRKKNAGAADVRPVLVLRPAARLRVPPGRPVIPDVERGSGRIFRAIPREMRAPTGALYSSRGARRGASREI